jgi:hypothetical protein
VRLRRARDEAGLTVRQIEEVLFPHVSKSGVIRLERRTEAPTFRKDRGRAALLVRLYNFELDDFDLTEADLPPAMDLRAVDRLGQVALRSRCFRESSELAVAS